MPGTHHYIGRFAPSPTGALHFGSLLAALASFLDARANQGRWLLRMEDLDPPREIAGAADQILRTLEHFGFYWDGPVRYQSQHLEQYQQVVQQLIQQQRAYPCDCSRQQLAQRNAVIYDGYCRERALNSRQSTATLTASHSTPAVAIRVKTTDTRIGFKDSIQGNYQQQLGEEVGDFVIHRKDGFYAYQLAVVIDDAEQKITHIVRGYDLLDSTPRQIYLQRLLQLPTPIYSHIPILVNHLGQKLSKQTFASAIDPERPARALFQGLTLLGQQPPEDLREATTHEMLRWGADHWDLSRIPRQPHLAESLLEP